MSAETTASAAATRYEHHVVAMQRERFWQHPEDAATIIAKHYVAHAMLALQTLEMIKAREFAPRPPFGTCSDIDWAITKNIEDIKKNHLFDFGTHIIEPKPQ